MTTVVHKVILKSNEPFDGKLPPFYPGQLLVEIPFAVRDSVSMAIRHRSKAKGRSPKWLDRVSDIKFVGYDGKQEACLYFEAPQIGEAAPEIYSQKTLFDEERPDPNDTAFDLLGDVLNDVQRRDADSTHFDHPLLDRIVKFRRFFGTRQRGPFSEVDLITSRYPQDRSAKLTYEIVEAAMALRGTTPVDQRVRIVGKLDLLEASTQRFSVILQSGEKMVGVYENIEELHGLWKRQVVVQGALVYRPSGRPLRIDADTINEAHGEPAIFSRLPQAPHARLDSSRFRRSQGPRSGIAAVIGNWPGDETDEEISAALEQCS